MTTDPTTTAPATPSQARKRVEDARRHLNARIIASAHLLDTPFSDAPDQSPWSRLKQAMGALAAALEQLDAEHATPAAPDQLDLPDGIRWDLTRWRCTRCDATGTWTGDDDPAAVDPVAAAADEARRHAADHQRWDAEREARHAA